MIPSVRAALLDTLRLNCKGVLSKGPSVCERCVDDKEEASARSVTDAHSTPGALCAPLRSPGGIGCIQVTASLSRLLQFRYCEQSPLTYRLAHRSSATTLDRRLYGASRGGVCAVAGSDEIHPLVCEQQSEPFCCSRCGNGIGQRDVLHDDPEAGPGYVTEAAFSICVEQGCQT